MRLFLAYDLEESIKKEIIKKTRFLREMYNNVKWVKKDNLHLTIKFIGERDKYNDIIEFIKDSYENNKIKNVKQIYLNEISAFPSIYNPRIFIINLLYPEIIIENITFINKSLEKFDIPGDKREPIPHITIGRIKRKINLKDIDLKKLDFKNIKVILSELRLYESILTPEGPIYKVLYRFK